MVPTGVSLMAQDEGITGVYDAVGQGSLGALLGGTCWLGYSVLAELAQRPEYRRISETIAKEMTRKWIKFHATGDDESKEDKLHAISVAFQRLRVRELFHDAAMTDGLFGRAQIYLDTGDTDNPGELEKPLPIIPQKIPRGGLKRLQHVEPIWTYPNAYNTTNPLASDYYEPQAWYIMGRRVHASRLLTFVGREVPDLLKPAYSFGGLAMSQMAMPYVDIWLRTRGAVARLIEKFSTPGLKTNMQAAIQNSGDTSIFSRMELFNALRSNDGLLLLDKDTEEFFNVSTPLGTLDHLQAQSQEHMASVSGIPLVVLTGITPSGLNASSQDEIRVFYGWIAAQQEHFFRPNLQRVLEVVQLSEFGEIDPEVTFSFEPLWQLDEAGKAAVRKTNADTAAVYIEAGVVSTEEERERLAAEEESLYAGIDLSAPAPMPPEDDKENDLFDPSNAIERQGAEGAETGANSGA